MGTTRQFLIFLLFFITTIAYSQSNSYNYQASLRNDDGSLLNNTNVSMRISILEDNSSGTTVYSEKHVVTTDAYGHLNVKIGDPTEVLSGSTSAINWSSNSYYLKIELDKTGGTSYVEMGVSPILSVPIAMHAETVTNADDADADPNNEMQVFHLDGNTLQLRDNADNIISSVNLPTGGVDADADPNNEIQFLTRAGNMISLSDGGSVEDMINDADADPSNEIQTLSLSGNNLSISNGNSLDLSALSGGGDNHWTRNSYGINSARSATIGDVSNPFLHLGSERIFWNNTSDDVTSVVQRNLLGVYDFDNGSKTEMTNSSINITGTDGSNRISLRSNGTTFFHNSITIGSVDLPQIKLNTGGLHWDRDPLEYATYIRKIGFGIGNDKGGAGTNLTKDGLIIGEDGGRQRVKFNVDGSGSLFTSLSIGDESGTILFLDSEHIDWHGSEGGYSSYISKPLMGILNSDDLTTTLMGESGLILTNGVGDETATITPYGNANFINNLTVGDERFVHLNMDALHLDWHNKDNGISSIIEPENMGVYDTDAGTGGAEITKNGFFALAADGAIEAAVSTDGSALFSKSITVGKYLDTQLSIDDTRMFWSQQVGGTPVFSRAGIVWENPSTSNPFMTVSKDRFYLGNGVSGGAAILHINSDANGTLSLYDGGAFRSAELGLESGGGSLSLFANGGPSYRNVRLGAQNGNRAAGALYLYHEDDLKIVSGVFADINIGYSYYLGTSSNNVYIGSPSGVSNKGYVTVLDASNTPQAGMWINSSNQGILFADNHSVSSPNPDKSADTEIVYSSLVSGENAAYERGTSKLQNGQVFVKFSTHFMAMINVKGMTVELTPLSADTYGLAVIKKKEDGFVVKELKGGTGNFEFDWKVTGTRKGYEEATVYQKKMSTPNTDQ